MRVGYFQFDPVFGEVARNLDLVTARLEQVEADLIVLPELFASGYQFVSQDEVARLAEPVPDGTTTKRLVEIARRRGVTIVAGLPERAGAQCFNSAVVVGPKGFIGCYRKTHLFFEETLFFTPGDTGFHVWDIGMGQGRCHDLFRLVLSGSGPYVGIAGRGYHCAPVEPGAAALPRLDGDALLGEPSLQRDGESNRQRSPRRQGSVDLYRDERSRQSARPHPASRFS